MDQEKLKNDAERRAGLLRNFGDFTDEELASLGTFNALSESVGGVEILLSGDFSEEYVVAMEVMASEAFKTAKEKVLAMATRWSEA